MISRRQFGIGGGVLWRSLPDWPAGYTSARGGRTVLRVVPQAEPQVFDPHQSAVSATPVNAALIYDTLFRWDADMVAAPADGRRGGKVRRWQALQLHAAARPEIPRWSQR